MANRHMKRCSTPLTNKKCKPKLQRGITFYQSEWPSSKSLQTINPGDGVEKRESYYTINENVNCCSYCEKQYAGSLKKQK